jgi:Arc/MetJ-type ribon-helix-helix transcriptional regulator
MPHIMEESLTIRLSKAYIDLMDKMIEKGVYSSKSEIIRESLRMFFDKYGEKIWQTQ